MPPKRTAGAASAGRKKGNAAMFEMAEPFTNGTILTDLGHRTWTIGPPIGQGGFGCIYECRSTTAKSPIHVVKVEPDSNGPLFCEMHFYLQLGKKTLQETFLKANRLNHLGVPQLVAHGMHVSTTTKRRYRFLVIPRYKQTLAAELQTKRILDEKRVQIIGKQMLDIFEYVHTHGYVHADLKAENILMNDPSELFLLDYGLSRKAALQYEEKPQRRHEGTLEFTSLDVHRGAAPSFRGDLEILFYNMLHWLGARLPWLNVTDGARVQQAKMTARSDPSGFIQTVFPQNKSISAKMLDGLSQYFREILLMNYTDQGDYQRLRDILNCQQRQRRSSVGAVSSRKPLAVVANEDDDTDEDKDDEPEVVPKKRTSPRRSNKTSMNVSVTRARSVSGDRRKTRNETMHSRSPSPPVQMLSARTPTLPIFQPPKIKYSRHEIEDDENDIDMSAILNPKLSSTRIERPRRVVAPAAPPPSFRSAMVTKNDSQSSRSKFIPPLPPTAPSTTSLATVDASKTERQHSDIIEKVLAGIPLTDNEIRRVIHRKK